MMRSSLKIITLSILLFSANGFTQETTRSIAFNAGIGLPQISTRDFFIGDTERDMFSQAGDIEMRFQLKQGYIYGFSIGLTRFGYVMKEDHRSNSSMAPPPNKWSIDNITALAIPFDFFLEEKIGSQNSKFTSSLSVGASMTLVKLSSSEHDVYYNENFTSSVPVHTPDRITQADFDTKIRIGAVASYNIRFKISNRLSAKVSIIGRYTQPYLSGSFSQPYLKDWYNFKFSGLFFKIGIERILHGA